MPEVAKVIEELGEAFVQFKRDHNARLDEIEKRANRPNLGGYPASDAARSDPQDRKSLDLGIRALIAGNQREADRHFGEIKGMAAGSGPGGGYFTTPEFSTQLTKVMLEVAPFAGLPRTINLRTGSVFEEVVDKATAGASWVGEVDARGDTTTPDIGQVRIEAHELYAQPKLSQKLIDTADIDVVTWLQAKVAEAFAYAEVDAYLNGNGVARPRGILTYATAATADATRTWGTLEHIVTGASGAFVAASAGPADCLISTVAALKPQYRQGAVWLMNRTTEAAVRKLKDQQSRFLLVDSLLAGQPNQLLGYPVVECEQMPDPAANSLSIAFGNVAKAYTIVRRLGVKFLSDPFTDKPNVRLYSYQRVGGDVNNFEAIKLVKFST